MKRKLGIGTLALVLAMGAGAAAAADSGLDQLDAAIKEITSRPEFADGSWGMDFSLPGADRPIYSMNREQLFSPASSVKIFTAGLVYEALGPDYRFRTPIYRTGPIQDGVLTGDLVLRASGDLLLGGRVNPDGTINLPATDHTYGAVADAVPVSDNPLGSLYDLAERIAAAGITEITGNIIVDNSLFREDTDNLGGVGGNYSISPIMLNDNIVDVLVTPGEKPGDPAILKILPETPYLTIINETTTVAPDATPNQGMMMVGNFVQKPSFTNDVTNPDGTHTVTLSGSVTLGGNPVLSTYNIPEPARFAEAALKMVLEEKGISANVDLLRAYDFSALSACYTDENKLAEIVSPPLRDELLPMMKLSSNLHTAAWPYIVGALVGGEYENAQLKGLAMQSDMYGRTGVRPSRSLVDLQMVSEIAGVRYSPESYANYLDYLYNLPYFEDYLSALPILGVDGTLSELNPDLAAAGHVFAKSGSSIAMSMVDGKRQGTLVKALAGFMELPDGRIVNFSVFTEYNTATPNAAPAQQAIDEIVNAVYEYMAAGR